MPSSAAATARKAKWYHIVTLKIRVRRISYISVAADTAKIPALVTTGLIVDGTAAFLAGTLASLRHLEPHGRVITPLPSTRRFTVDPPEPLFRLTPTTCCAKKGRSPRDMGPRRRSGRGHGRTTTDHPQRWKGRSGGVGGVFGVERPRAASGRQGSV